MNVVSLTPKRPADAFAGQLPQLLELCRRVGLPPITVSRRFAEQVLSAGALTTALNIHPLYDLVWCVRGSIKGLMPCGRTTTPAGEVFQIEFWSLAANGEPILQNVTATVVAGANEGQRVHLSLPEEQHMESTGRPIVLVVEDSADVAEVERLLLERAGFVVVVIETGLSGLTFAQSQLPAAIVLDVDLPDIDGLEICRRLKGDPSTRRIPVLVCSGNSDACEGARKAGADGFLAKPGEVAQLAARVLELLSAADKSATRSV